MVPMMIIHNTVSKVIVANFSIKRFHSIWFKSFVLLQM